MIKNSELKKLLSDQLVKAHYEISEIVQEKLTEYLLLLEKWNSTYNLTSVRDIKQMVVQHILDSLSIAEFVQGKNILDVGTGPGLPGIPLALLQPERDFFLLDSNGKKTRFLTHAVQVLGISNINVIQARVEQFKPNIQFDTIISRAFSSIKNFLENAQHLLSNQGVFLAMKGTYPADEIAEISSRFSMMAVHPLHIPQLEAQRHLVVISCKNH